MAADFVLPPGDGHVLTITARSSIDGDAMVIPYQRCILRGIVIDTCLVRFSRGYAKLTAYNITPEPLLLPALLSAAWNVSLPLHPPHHSLGEHPRHVLPMLSRPL